MKPLRVTYAAGMVNIDSDDISFGYIPGMYTGGRAGVGLQVDAHVDRAACERMCERIAEAVVEFAANAEAHGRRSRTVQPLVGHSESEGGRE